MSPVDSTEVLLEQVRTMLAEQRINDAINYLRSQGSRSSEVQNAFAVCYLRCGQTEKALTILRELLFTDGPADIDESAPEKFKANFVTALMMSGNHGGGLAYLKGLNGANSPGTRRLKEAVASWKQKVGIFRRLCLTLTSSGQGDPMTFDYPPGDV